MLTAGQKETILQLNRETKCGVVVGYHACRFLEFDEELVLEFLYDNNLVDCPSIFDYPEWADRPAHWDLR